MIVQPLAVQTPLGGDARGESSRDGGRMHDGIHILGHTARIVGQQHERAAVERHFQSHALGGRKFRKSVQRGLYLRLGQIFQRHIRE